MSQTTKPSSSASPSPLDLSYKHIIAISVPVLIANIAMPMQGAIDVAVVGHFNQHFSLAGLGIATQLWLLTVVSFNFLQYASSGLSAQAVGRQATDTTSRFELVDILYRSLGLAVVLGLLLLLFKPLIIHYGLELLGAQPASRAAAQTYLDIRFYGIIFELMNLAFIGWFAGQGQTRLLMRVQILISVINIILTLFFVYVLKLGLVGVALGTTFGYITGFGWAYYLAYKQVIKPLGYGARFIDRFYEIYAISKVLRLFSLNKDIFIRTILLTLSFAWITRLSAQQGDLIMATNAVLLQVLNFSALALDGVAVAAESLAGQAVARKVRTQFIMVIKRTGLVTVLLAITLSLVWWLILPYFLAAMTDISSVYELAMEYRYAALMLPVVGAGAYWLDGVMFGLTLGSKIRQVAIIVAVIFFPLTWVVYEQYGHSHAMPVIWFCIYWLLISRFVIGSIVLWRYQDQILPEQHQRHMLAKTTED